MRAHGRLGMWFKYIATGGHDTTLQEALFGTGSYDLPLSLGNTVKGYLINLELRCWLHVHNINGLKIC